MPGKNETAADAKLVSRGFAQPLVQEFLEPCDLLQVMYVTITSVQTNFRRAQVLLPGGETDTLAYGSVVPTIGEFWRAFYFENGNKRLNGPV